MTLHLAAAAAYRPEPQVPQARRPHASPDAFRSAMRQIPAAVTVVTTAVHGIRHVLTATAVVPVSAEPPQVLVCVDAHSRSSRSIRRAGCFAVNYLTGEHTAIAEAFAAPAGDPEDRFRHGTWNQTPSGTPLLTDAAAALECTVVTQIRSGTHVLFIGEARHVRWHEDKTLVYKRRTFGQF